MRELGRRADVSGSLISEVVNGNVPASTGFCVAVAGALDEDPLMLLYLAGHISEPPSPVPEEQEAVKILRDLPTQTRRLALAMLRGLKEETRGEKKGELGARTLPAREQWFPEAVTFEGVTEESLRAEVMEQISRICDDSPDDLEALACLFNQYASLKRRNRQEVEQPA